MIEKNKILSIMLISCVISSLFAISFSSTSTECECDLTEVELSIQALNSTISSQYSNITDLYNEYILLNQTLNDSIDNYNYLSDYINNVNMSVDELADYMNEMNDTLNSIGDLTSIIDNLNDSISLINDSYNILLINFNYLYNNFTSYVSLLNSLSNVTLLIGWINGNISSIQSDISDIESDISDIESDISTIQGQISTIQGQILTIQGQITTLQGLVTTRIPPISVDVTVWAHLSYIYEWKWGILHSDTSSFFDAMFIAPYTASFKIGYSFMSNVASRNDHFHIYAGKSAASGAISLTNCLNNEQAQFNSTNKDIIYQYTTATFSLTVGDILCSSLRKQDNTGSGYLILVGCWIQKV